MKKQPGDYPIPFDKNGNQMHYAGYHMAEMRKNEEFEDALIYQDYCRGRSAAYFIFKRHSTGTEVTMFMAEMHSILPRMHLGGVLKGRFRFVKRGDNYGVLPIQTDVSWSHRRNTVLEDVENRYMLPEHLAEQIGNPAGTGKHVR